MLPQIAQTPEERLILTFDKLFGIPNNCEDLFYNKHPILITSSFGNLVGGFIAIVVANLAITNVLDSLRKSGLGNSQPSVNITTPFVTKPRKEDLIKL